MIGFFRRIRKKLVDDNQFLKYSRYAVGEIVLVMVGILLALQVNNWNEQKKLDKQKENYLSNLQLDLELDLTSIDLALKNLNLYEKEGFYLLGVINGENEKIDKVRLLKSLAYNNYFSIFRPTRATYEDLISSGNLNLIENNELKVALSQYYLENDWMEQFSQRVKDTYWYVVREEVFKVVDPIFMRTHYELEDFPNRDPYIGFDDIEVDYEQIKKNKSLRSATSRALTLRVWHRNLLEDSQKEIYKILDLLK